MKVLQVTELEAYVELLQQEEGEVANLFRDLLIGVTSFFRDEGAFEALANLVVPKLFEGKGASDTLRVWVPGCSTGEEAYTLAMLLDQAFPTSEPPRRFGITATDVSQPALSLARLATYPLNRLEEIPARYRSNTVELLADEQFRIAERLRKRVGYACVNLMHASRAPLRQLDLIYCQNVLIYFARERRGELLDGLARLLRPNGLLVLGPGEVTGWTHPQLVRTGGRQTLAFLRQSKETRA